MMMLAQFYISMLQLMCVVSVLSQFDRHPAENKIHSNYNKNIGHLFRNCVRNCVSLLFLIVFG